jgi:hypothetical protein
VVAKQMIFPSSNGKIADLSRIGQIVYPELPLQA